MPTRADFYIGRGKNSVWIGAIAADGIPSANPEVLIGVRSESEYRTKVELIIQEASHYGTRQEQGYPFPWAECPWMSDFAYAFDEGKTWVSDCRKWIEFTSEVLVAGFEFPKGKDEFPDLTSIKSVPLGRRSGFITLPNGIF